MRPAAARPVACAAVAAAGLGLAMALPPGAPAWAAWGALAVSCLGSALAALLADRAHPA